MNEKHPRTNFNMRNSSTQKVLAFAGLLASATAVQAATHTVTSGANTGAGTFREAVSLSAANDTIIFAESLTGTPINLRTTDVTIGHSLVILGNAANWTSIHGGTSTRLISITAGDVVISNVNLRYAFNNSGNGGGIAVLGGSLELRNALVYMNSAQNGGAVYVRNAEFRAFDCTFLENTAVGTADGQGGGAVHASGTGSVHLERTNMFANHSMSQGGGVWNGMADFTMDHSPITGSNANGQGGGGIYNAGGTISARYSQISENTAPTAGGLGGGILNVGGTITVFSSGISANSAAASGGGIENMGAGASVGLEWSQLEGNTTPGNAGLRSAGAVRVSDGASFAINNGTINNNVATFGTAGLSIVGASEVTLHNVTMNANRAQNSEAGFGGAAVHNNGGTLVITASRFTNNVAGGDYHDGAALFQDAGTLDLSGSTVTGNSAVTSGGAFYLAGGSATITNVEFASNSAAGGAWNNGGGAIYNNAITVLTGVTIAENDATGALGNGGGIYNAGDLTVAASTISGNSATFHGGGILSTGALSLQRSTVVYNTAGGIGGGLAVTGEGSANVGGSIIAVNTASASEPQDVVSTSGAIVSNGYNLIGRDDASHFAAVPTDIEGTSASPVNPVLAALADNGGTTRTHAIACGSPAIGRGNPADTQVDQRGEPVFAVRDIGSYELQMSCGCTETVFLAITLDNFGSETTWRIIDDASNVVLASGGPYADGLAGTVITEEICLPRACFRLQVRDAGGNGITNGGYVLSDESGRKIIDALHGGADFGSVSGLSNGLGAGRGFCLPLSNQRVIAAWCGRELLYHGNTQVYAANQPGATQYGFWFFDPHGGYSRTVSSTEINIWPTRWITSPLPADVWLNVRVRSMRDGVWSPYGPACPIIFRSALVGMVEDAQSTLESVLGNATLTVFPNPNDGENITVVMNELGDGAKQVRMEMLDLNGRVVDVRTFGNDGPTLHRTIDLGGLSKGMYMLRLQVNDRFFMERIVVR